MRPEDDPGHPDYAHRLSPKLHEGAANRIMDWIGYGLGRAVRWFVNIVNTRSRPT